MQEGFTKTIGALALLALSASLPFSRTMAQAGVRNPNSECGPVIVFQAAGPTGTAIQSSIEEFRNALWGTNHGNSPGLDDTDKQDVVMMDDFVYGEPQPAH